MPLNLGSRSVVSLSKMLVRSFAFSESIFRQGRFALDVVVIVDTEDVMEAGEGDAIGEGAIARTDPVDDVPT
jgi:hypothetical protein